MGNICSAPNDYIITLKEKYRRRKICIEKLR